MKNDLIAQVKTDVVKSNKPKYERPDLIDLDVSETETGSSGTGEDALFTFLS